MPHEDMMQTTHLRQPVRYPRLVLFARGTIKLLGNLLKVLSYAVYAVAPRWRLGLPSHSPALWSSKSPSLIPRTIWQTNFTGRVTLPVYLNYLFNRLMAPTYEYRFMVTADRETFIRDSFDESTLNTYQKIQIGAAQADLWRLLVLYRHGGVYMDIDAHLVWPLGCILAPEDRELFLQIKTGEISNYFIASAPNNPNVADLIVRVCENVRSPNSTNVYEITGPGVFNAVFADRSVPVRYYLYTCNQGNFTNEYFQYMDKPRGKWTKEQKTIDVIRRD